MGAAAPAVSSVSGRYAGPYAVPGRYFGDCRTLLRDVPDGTIQTCVTSPPYWGLRHYLEVESAGAELEIGTEPTPEEYVANMVEVFREVRRALRDDGTLWLNLGDSYAHGGCGARDAERWPKQQRNDHMPKHRKSATGLKPKDLVGIPWRVAFALQADGWYLRSDIVWHKPAPMPESVKDRPTRSHEFVFLLAKSERYFYDARAIREVSVSVSDSGNGYARPERASVDGVHAGQADGWTRESAGGFRNARDVWTIGPEPITEAHFAVMPTALAKRCVLAGAPAGAVVLDPFFGSGTVGRVAEDLGRSWLGFDLNPGYDAIQARRLAQLGLLDLEARP